MTKKPIYLLGDIHGIYDVPIGLVFQHKIKDSIIIQVGDFGVGFRPYLEDMKKLEELNDVLKDYNTIIYAIRGNHDYPMAFTKEGLYNLSNIIFLEDYTVINLEGLNFLFVGGAISIDRSARTPNKSYWEKEKFVLKTEKLKKIKNIDIVVSHTSPDFANPATFNSLVYQWYAKDLSFYEMFGVKKDLLTELKKERKNITKMYNILKKNNKIIKFFYGHFHFSSKEIINDTEFVLLDINELYELKI